MNQNEPRDEFAERLLNELKHEVKERAVDSPQESGKRKLFGLRPRVLGVAAGVLAVTAAAVLGPSAFFKDRGTSAVAVENNGDGTISVKFSEPEPEELEQALAEHGITSVVDVLPVGKTCQAKRFVKWPQPSNDDINYLSRHERQDNQYTLGIDVAKWNDDYTLVIELPEEYPGPDSNWDPMKSDPWVDVQPIWGPVTECVPEDIKPQQPPTTSWVPHDISDTPDPTQ